MKKRYYICFPRCHKRMRRFSQDVDRERGFYYCVRGQRVTHYASLGAISEEWPDAVFEDAVRQGVTRNSGRVR